MIPQRIRTACVLFFPFGWKGNRRCIAAIKDDCMLIPRLVIAQPRTSEKNRHHIPLPHAQHPVFSSGRIMHAHRASHPIYENIPSKTS